MGKRKVEKRKTSLRGRQRLAGRSNPANFSISCKQKLDHHAEQAIVRLVMTNPPQPSAKLGGGLKTSLQGRADLRTDENEHVIAHAYVIADSFVIAHLLRDLIRLRKREDFSTTSSLPLRNDETRPNPLSQTIINRLLGRVLKREGAPSSLQGRELERGVNVKSPLIPLYKGGTSPNPSPSLHLPWRGKKAAFTLAETLITLGIIGVVAAMTIPTLINKHKEHVTVNKVKKFYSTMSQAQLMAIKDNGPTEEWNVSDGQTQQSAQELFSYFKPYLKILKDCGTSGCGFSREIKYLNGSLRNGHYDNDSFYYKFILNDGTYVYMRSSITYCKDADGGYNDVCSLLWIDVNGKQAPNTFGKDIFLFVILKYKISPSRNDDCYKNSTGWGCASYIITKGNMDYLH